MAIIPKLFWTTLTNISVTNFKCNRRRNDNMNNSKFWLDLKRGRQAEVLVTNAFRMMGYGVMDVTKNPVFWKKDVDLLIWDHDETKYMFECKADWNMHKTGNVVLELTSKTGSQGWFRTSEATHFAICDMQNRICYIARASELREYAQQHPDLPQIRLNDCECLLINVNECPLFQKIHI